MSGISCGLVRHGDPHGVVDDGQVWLILPVAAVRGEVFGASDSAADGAERDRGRGARVSSATGDCPLIDRMDSKLAVSSAFNAAAQ